jgi:hypothetical protein
MTEQMTIATALEHLLQNAGITAALAPAKRAGVAGKIVFKLEKQVLKYNVVFKNEWRNHHLQQLINYKNGNNLPLIAVGNSLFPKMKQQLRQLNIAYLEANGNLFLKSNGTTILIDTNKTAVNTEKKAGRAFTKTGLKLVFQFLLDENWLNMPYRQIGERMAIGTGNITNIMNGLKQEGYLLPLNKNDYQMYNKRKLLERWMEEYENRLKPALKIGTFRFLKNDELQDWKELRLKKNRTCWGGEPAADLLTGHLRPAELTLYTAETRNELIKNYKLVPDENGHIVAYEKFWHGDEMNDQIAPAVLVYADLMNTGDARCIETAQKIDDGILQGKF